MRISVIIIYSDKIQNIKNILEGEKNMKNKKEWEMKFERYDANAETKKIEVLTEKLNNKTITKEEYNELKKAETINKNIKQVANIIELKKELEEAQSKIKKEIAKINDEKKEHEKDEEIEKDDETLEKELNKIQAELEIVEKSLKNTNLKDNDRKKLEDKYKDLINKRDENNKLFVKNQRKGKENKKTDREVNLEELEKKSIELGVKIGKCHLAGRILMAGGTWNSIYVKNSKNQKYKAKNGKITEKFGKETIGKTLDQIGKNVSQIMEKQNPDNRKTKEETALTITSKFEQKHPKLARFFNMAKNIFWRKDKKKVETQPTQDTENSETKSQRDEFIDYLKQVAENGKDGIKQQDKEAAKARLELKKKEAYERETNKFGKAYAEKSYTYKNESKEENENEL